MNLHFFNFKFLEISDISGLLTPNQRLNEDKFGGFHLSKIRNGNREMVQNFTENPMKQSVIS